MAPSFEQNCWDEKLPLLIMAYRTAEHESTGYTPAKVMTGRELRLPGDVATGVPFDEQEAIVPEYVKSLKHTLTEVHDHVRDNLKIASGAMKLRCDAKASQETFSPGDQVWLYNPQRKKGQCAKLSSAWEGAYSVVDRLSDVTYRIQKKGATRCKVVHFNRLWKDQGPPKCSWTKNAEERKSDVLEPDADQVGQESPSSPEHEAAAVGNQSDSGRRISSRVRRRPDRYGEWA